MKFYIISIILNIGILFIPVFTLLKNTEDSEKIITVNLENMSFENNDNQVNKEQESSDKKNREVNNDGKSVTAQNTVKNNNVKKNIETAGKKEKTEDRADAPDKNGKPVINSVINNNSRNGSHQADNSEKSSGLASDKSERSDSTGKMTKRSTGNENARTHDETGNTDNIKNTANVCREGVDFTVIYNPNLQYPVAAERLRLRNTVVVNVRLNFNSSGTVSVISMSGGDRIFQSEAGKAAGKIRVKIKNPETLKCTITKPFRFNPR